VAAIFPADVIKIVVAYQARAAATLAARKASNGAFFSIFFDRQFHHRRRLFGPNPQMRDC
jgi:hypothetical protein